ncbi:DUF4259 domain-containing protein [Actinocorallia longicatena]|uniref:Uncharacterized protein n=1 Tax=Actinocorallia longicatena TaxID=111803 RepID=A0ABP6QHB4_9ACTN
MDLPFAGTFDSDEASDVLWDLDEADDVVAAMTDLLVDFLEDNEEYVNEGASEAALAVACLIAARLSGIAPEADEEAHHWLGRNLFEVSEELRELAASAFTLALRYEDNHLNQFASQRQWHLLREHLEPYRRSLFGVPQRVPDLYEPDLSEGDWFVVDLFGPYGPVPDDAPYSTAVTALADTINTSPEWMEWWLPAGLQSLIVHARLERDGGAPAVGGIWNGLTRGRTTVRLEQDLLYLDVLDEDRLAADLAAGLQRVADRLGLGPLPSLSPAASSRSPRRVPRSSPRAERTSPPPPAPVRLNVVRASHQL